MQIGKVETDRCIGEQKVMRYEQPTSAKQAAGMLAKEKGAAFLLAGGTDLLVKLKMGMVEPDLVVDIKHIAKRVWWASYFSSWLSIYHQFGVPGGPR